VRTAVLVGVVAVLVAVAGCSSQTEPETQSAAAGASTSTGELIEAKDATGHQLRQVEAEGAPSVDIAVAPDSMKGWNLQITTDNWQWAPEDAGSEVAANQGHAHLFINGEKATRIYGDWFYLSDTLVGTGDEISVTLNANDHSTWAITGEAISATTTVEASSASMDDAHHNHTDHGSHSNQ